MRNVIGDIEHKRKLKESGNLIIFSDSKARPAPWKNLHRELTARLGKSWTKKFFQGKLHGRPRTEAKKIWQRFVLE